jgi:hypothetical protein
MKEVFFSKKKKKMKEVFDKKIKNGDMGFEYV